MRPLVFAHRGGAALAPENTIAAFDRGLECGADGLEFDVQLSKDGVPVIMHDPTVDRTTNGTGAVADLTAAELAALDAGFHFGTAEDRPWRGRCGGVPTLREVLSRYAGTELIVELKTADPRLPHLAVDMIRAAGLSERVRIGSFHESALKAVRELAPELRTGADANEIKGGVAATIFDATADPLPFYAFQVPEVFGGQRIVTQEFVARARTSGVGFTVWIVNEPSDICRLLDWGVTEVITDRPDVAVPTVHDWHAAHSR
jgi:glycerophosphoryl diester phosphodiesterase